MSSRLQHLQFAKFHLSTRVTSNKVDDSQPVGLGHRALKIFTIYPSNYVRVSRQVLQHFFFFFFLFFLKTHWSFIQGSQPIKGGQKYQAIFLQGLGGKAVF